MNARALLTVNLYTLDEAVDLGCAKKIAKDLTHFIRTSSEPCLNASGLRQAGLPLLQLLVSARLYAETEGKAMRIEAPEDGTLMRLLAAFGLDPQQCAAEIVASSSVPSHELQSRGSEK